MPVGTPAWAKPPILDFCEPRAEGAKAADRPLHLPHRSHLPTLTPPSKHPIGKPRAGVPHSTSLLTCRFLFHLHSPSLITFFFCCSSHSEKDKKNHLRSSELTWIETAKMTSENGTTLPQDTAAAGAEVQEVKGKGKAAAEQHVDTAMDEDDDDEEDDDEEVCLTPRPCGTWCPSIELITN